VGDCTSTGDGSGLSFKECHVTCDSGDGCNNDLETVAAKFSVGNVDQCYNCFYQEADDGSILGIIINLKEFEITVTTVHHTFFKIKNLRRAYK